MKRFVIFMLAIGIILAVAALLDIFAKGMAERQIASGIQSGLDLESQPQVQITGFPFVLDLAGGVLERVTVTSEGFGEEPIVFDEAELSLDNVRLDFSELFSGEADGVQIGGGDGSVALTAPSLNEALDKRGIPVALTFASGDVVVSAEGVGEERGSLALDGRDLVVSSPSRPEGFRLRLPAIADGLTYRSVAVRGDRAILEIGLSAGRFRLPG